MTDEADPDIGLLVGAAMRLAAMVAMAPAPERKIREKINEILYERDTLDAVRRNILTKREAAVLLLDHLLMTIPHISMDLHGADPWSDEELLVTIERGMFGLR
jgi:hypothetical protein